MEFNYKKLGPGLIRPIIQFDLHYGPFFYAGEALVDSGADRCLFPKNLGQNIGIDFNKCKKELTAGVGGIAETFLEQVTLKIGGISIETMAGFTEGLDNSNMCLLGQKGVFEKFIVSFDRLAGKVEFKLRL